MGQLHRGLLCGLAGLLMMVACGCWGGEIVDRDDQVPIATLLTFINASSDKFISEIPSHPDIPGAPNKLVLELGTVIADPSLDAGDVEVAQEAVRGRFLSSRLITDRFLIVQNFHRSKADADKIGVSPDAVAATPDRYDPNTIYTLNGRFQKVGRSERNLYQLQLNLIHWKTRKIVLNKTFMQTVSRY